MCAIAGVAGPGDAAAQSACAARLGRALAHRGPDGAGVVTFPGACLVHRRLAIIDLSPGGHQPMSTADGRWHIVYNGEIYNYRELRSQLVAEGEVFTGNSDTEVLLRLIARDGPGALARVRGMFAFGLWDDRERTLLLARDRFGIKPLYVAHDRHRIAFASEVGALIAAGLVERAIDEAAVLAYLRWGSVLPPLTTVRGVTALEPGTWRTFDRHLASTGGTFADARCLWAGTPAALSRDSLVDATREALDRSVTAHLVADVPVGVFLSGGLDSAALTAIARPHVADLRTYTVVVSERDYSEADRAAAVARHFGTTHHTLRVEADSIVNDWPHLLRHMDQPTHDGVNSYFVSKAVAATGVKAVLSGVGGDELFGGYPSFRRLPRAMRLARTASMLMPVAARAASFRQPPARAARWRHLGASDGDPFEMYRALRGFLMPAEIDAVAGDRLRSAPDASARVDEAEAALKRAAGDETDYATAARLETTVYQRMQLLRDIDAMSMAHSLEVRVPFVDAPLIGTVWPRLGADPGLIPGKQLLTASTPAPLRGEILGQPKRGFTLPFEHWLDGPLSEIVRDGLASLARDRWVSSDTPATIWRQWQARDIHWSRAWGLGVLGCFLDAAEGRRA